MRRTALLIVAGVVAISAPLQAVLPVVTLPYGGVGQPYYASLKIQDYPYVNLTGTLPAGLVYNGDSKEILGTPLEAGAFRLTLGVENAFGTSGSEVLTLNVMQISTPSLLPSGSVCSSFSQTFAVSYAPPPPYLWTMVAQTPLPGLTLDSSTGVLSGNPTSGGNFSFNLEALSTATGVYATGNVTLNIASFCLSPSLPDGDANSPYRTVLTPKGGTAPFRWTAIGTFPNGVSIDSNSGVLSGTPTVPGKYTFSVQVTDSTSATATQSFTLTINPSLVFTTTSPLPHGTAGANYSQTFTASGGLAPYVFATSNP